MKIKADILHSPFLFNGVHYDLFYPIIIFYPLVYPLLVLIAEDVPVILLHKVIYLLVVMLYLVSVHPLFIFIALSIVILFFKLLYYF